jgi:hypothetical protein
MNRTETKYANGRHLLLIGLVIFILLYVPFWLYENGVGWMDVTAVTDLAGQSSTVSAAAVLVSLDLLHAKGLLPDAAFLRPLDTFMTVLSSSFCSYGWLCPSCFTCAPQSICRFIM